MALKVCTCYQGKRNQTKRKSSSFFLIQASQRCGLDSISIFSDQILQTKVFFSKTWIRSRSSYLKLNRNPSLVCSPYLYFIYFQKSLSPMLSIFAICILFISRYCQVENNIGNLFRESLYKHGLYLQLCSRRLWFIITFRTVTHT